MTIKSPILEEVSFRLLLKPTRYNVSLSIATFVFFITDIIGHDISLLTSTIRLVLCILLFFLLYHFVGFDNDYIKNIDQKKLLIASSLLFGFMHLFNFSPIFKDIFFLYPIYVLPQIALGFVLGIVRIRNGFIWAVCLHVLVNGSMTWYRLF
ncbi:CPBP family glutamic-type intramembrane protease [Spirosoma flavum]|uniref:Type II CAAX prenyl endopeptidase Rce1 family protein n=1 Tax=Spirosoma flavum TaxID=2048557 RepID=A0ABW6AK53_9BACT